MLPILLLITLFCGLIATRVALPPLIGYLAAGFVLYRLGISHESVPALQHFADVGVYLLLFVIGLKLDLKSLLRPEIWAVASLHMLVSVLIMVMGLKGLALWGIHQLQGFETHQFFLLAFALSFSSTVFAVKVLEGKGDMTSLYGRVAIGILIMQDLFAVIFLTFSKGQWPSPFALGLLVLPFLRPLIYRVFDRVGHGELLVIFGLGLVLVLGVELFELVGLKPDLGALVAGLLLAGHPKASELGRALFYFKEVFLVAFFLGIGLNGLPQLMDYGLAALLSLIIPFKIALFLALLAIFRLRTRTAWLSSLTLGNFSEFGLIVTVVAVDQGWLPAQWLVINALALSFSYLIGSPLNKYPRTIYQRLRPYFKVLERKRLHPEDRPIDLGKPRFVIMGMGRIGSGAYDELASRFDDEILGIEQQKEIVDFHVARGRNVVMGDASDHDFWDKINPSGTVELVLLAMPQHKGNLFAMERLAASRYKGRVSAVVRYTDEGEILRENGIDSVYNIYDAAGAGFAENAVEAFIGPLPEHRKTAGGAGAAE